MGPKIHFPTEEEEKASIEKFFAQEMEMRQERRAAVKLAIPALQRLCAVLRERSGQPYHLREILYSLWNGKPAPFVDIVHFDWEIRRDLAAVILAWGYEDEEVKFFYDALKQAVAEAGQWKWFEQEHENAQQCIDYLKSLDYRVYAPKEAST